jgi:hypothetical protein
MTKLTSIVGESRFLAWVASKRTDNFLKRLLLQRPGPNKQAQSLQVRSVETSTWPGTMKAGSSNNIQRVLGKEPNG